VFFRNVSAKEQDGLPVYKERFYPNFTGHWALGAGLPILLSAKVQPSQRGEKKNEGGKHSKAKVLTQFLGFWRYNP